jgi:4-amino-4-deoxy-L-arabinose transferase-like glycosyltransferase
MDLPSILPNALPANITRGHPLLFTFLGGTWLWLFGNTIVNAHIFSTLVSVVLIVSVYFITNELCSKNAGIIACTTLMLQPVFLSQSGMVLPEIMVALFSLLSLYFFYKNKILLCSVFLTALLFTKESGIVVLLTIYLLEFYNIIKYKKLSSKRILSLLMPSAAITIFFVLQKIMMGWYFFPEHTSLMDFNPNSIFEKMKQYFSFTFIYQGRNVLFFIALGLIIFKSIKLKTSLFDKKIVVTWVMFTILYLVFSSINFYSARYAMSIILPFIIGFSIVTEKILRNNWFKSVLIFGIAFHFVLVNIQRQDNSDQTLGYRHCVKLQEEVIAYLQENHLEEKNYMQGFC